MSNDFFFIVLTFRKINSFLYSADASKAHEVAVRRAAQLRRLRRQAQNDADGRAAKMLASIERNDKQHTPAHTARRKTKRAAAGLNVAPAAVGVGHYNARLCVLNGAPNTLQFYDGKHFFKKKFFPIFCI